MLSSHLVYAEVRTYELKDFSKLQTSQVSPYLIQKDAAVEAKNLRANISVGALTKRPVMYQYGSIGDFSVKSLHRYYKADGTKYLIASGSTKLFSGSDATGVFTTIRDSLTDGRRFQCVTYKDVAICGNGVDNVQKWDGKTLTTDNLDSARTANILTTDLGAPFAELNTGSNLTASRWYQYKVAFYDGTTYSYSNARSNPILTGSSVQDITLTDIPLGPSGTTQRIIYRTSGQTSRANVVASTTFMRVATISDNTTRTYNDTLSDANLAADTAPTFSTVSAGINATVPKGKFLELHKERLFISGNPTFQSDFYWSDTFNPDYYDPVSYDQIRPDDGDVITFMKNFLGIMTFGKTNTIQKLYTDNADDTSWEISNPFSFIGSPAPYSVVVTPLGIVYLGRDGIYQFNGQSSQLISDTVTDVINDIADTNITETAGSFYNNEYQLAYTSTSSGAAYNDKVLVLDTVRDSYSIDTKNVNCFAVLNSGTDFGVLYSGSSAADGKVFAHTLSANTLNERFKSDLQSGTVDSVRIYGEEDDPAMDIGWATIDSLAMTIDAMTGIVDRPSTTGYWYSPVIQINATALNKLYWNEDLGSFGNVTFAVRLASTSVGVASASWSNEVSDPSGSDLSGVTADVYIQIRATLTTTDINFSPVVQLGDNYVIKLAYQAAGTTGETSVLSLWKSGFYNFEIPGYKKRIRRIDVHYTGTEGTLNFALANSENTASDSFNIELATLPSSSASDQYLGDNTHRIYEYLPAVNSPTFNTPIGEYWQFTVTENGTNPWSIDRVVIYYDIEEQTDTY